MPLNLNHFQECCAHGWKSLSLFILLLFCFASTLMNCSLQRKQVQEIHGISCSLSFLCSFWWNKPATTTQHSPATKSDPATGRSWFKATPPDNITPHLRLRVCSLQLTLTHLRGPGHVFTCNTFPLKVKNNNSFCWKSTQFWTVGRFVINVSKSAKTENPRGNLLVGGSRMGVENPL